MNDFATLTAVLSIGENKFAIDVPDGWQQGRGTFGGFGLACIVRAIETTEPNGERALRTLNAELCGPLMPGRAEISIEILRRGAGMTTVAARMIQNDSVVAHATALLGRSREGKTYDGLSKPDLHVAGQLMPSEGPFPRFARFFEYRVIGALPFSGHDVAEVQTWVRMREPGKTFDTAQLTAFADATWPAMFPTQTIVQPMSTISFALQTFGTVGRLALGSADLSSSARIVGARWARRGNAGDLERRRTPFGDQSSNVRDDAITAQSMTSTASIAQADAMAALQGH